MRQVFFLERHNGERFCIASHPVADPVGGILLVPPFAEEMNRCRQQASRAARAFSQLGWLVLQMDLDGTGDSSGQFGQATWESWCDDLSCAHEWLSAACPEGAPIVTWSIRAGNLLATDWMSRTGVQSPLLAWQPVPSGRQAIGTFLRLKAASELLDGVQSKAVIRRARESLDAGHTIEIAGYTLSPSIARGMEGVSGSLPPDFDEPVMLVEVSPTRDAPESPVIRSLLERWATGGARSESARAIGPRFWQTQETTVAEEAIVCSRRFLEGIGQ